MATLEQELERDLDSHTFDHKNREEKKNDLSIHKQKGTMNHLWKQVWTNIYLIAVMKQLTIDEWKKRKRK